MDTKRVLLIFLIAVAVIASVSARLFGFNNNDNEDIKTHGGVQIEH